MTENKFPYQALVRDPTLEEKAAQVDWCRKAGKHNKVWIVYHGDTHGVVFDNYFFADINVRNAFRTEFDIPHPKQPCHFGQ